MAKVQGPIWLTDQFFSEGIMSIATSEALGTFYIPAGGLSDVERTEIATISIKSGEAKLEKLILKQYYDNRAINVLVCQEGTSRIFFGTYPYDPASEFKGVIGYSSTEKYGFFGETEIRLPVELTESTAFFCATYDNNNDEIYFSAQINSKEDPSLCGLIIIDAVNREYKKTIFFSNNSSIALMNKVAVSCHKRIYFSVEVGKSGDVKNDIACFDDSTNNLDYMAKLTEIDGYCQTVLGVAVDNENDIVYIISSYVVPDTINDFFTRVQKLDAKTHKLLGYFDVEKNKYYGCPIIDQEKQLMFLLSDYDIHVVDLVLQKVINRIAVSSDNLCQMAWNKTENCILVTALTDDGHAECYAVFDPEITDA